MAYYVTQLIIFIFLLLAHQLPAQNTVVNPDTIPDNPAIIASYFSPDTENTSAQALYRIKGGTLRPVYAPATSHQYGIEISSFRNLGKTSLYGYASYVRHVREGQQHNGMFRPASPLITFADTVRGKQEGETYHLSATVCQHFPTHWNAGISIGYIAGNNAKDTDPRNKNNINDVKITPGINYLAGRIRLGVSFSWLRGRETISYSSFGEESKNGVTYYPLWFYTTETFANGIYANRYYHRNSYSPAFQFQYRDRKWYIFFQPDYTRNSEKIWINLAMQQSGGETEGRIFRLKNKTEYTSQRFIHHFSPVFTHAQYKGYDLSQQLGKDNRVYETILRTQRSQITSTTAEINYMLCPDGAPVWKTMATVAYSHQETSFRIYPADFIRTLSHIALSAGYARQFYFSKNLLDCGLHINYSKGQGVQPDLEKLNGNTTIRLNHHLLTGEFDYLTAATAGTALCLSYTWQFNQNSRLYTKINYDFRHTLRASPVKGSSNSLCFNFGVIF